jgi:FixJ family two-component response regulator
MPELTGKETAERVQALRPDIAVLYMSGYAAPLLTARGSFGTGVALLEKPFSEAALLDKVRQAIAADQRTSGVRSTSRSRERLQP